MAGTARGAAAGPVGCGTSPSEGAAFIPGPSLDGPNVVTYPLGPYKFEADARKEIQQGFRYRGGCGRSSTATIPPDVEAEVQEIVIAEDPDRCRFLVVIGTPAD